MFNFTMFAVVRVLCDKSCCSVVKKLSGRPHGEQTRLLFFVFFFQLTSSLDANMTFLSPGVI